jgi:transposase
MRSTRRVCLGACMRCWAHTRRAFLKAESVDPKPVAQALEMIRALYAIEAALRTTGADANTILGTRCARSEPIIDRLFEWVRAEIGKPELLPSSALAKALSYARERGLREFLRDAWLALDTNDLERALRVIPMGKKNYHPASRINELAPRDWAVRFAHDPIRSDLARSQ